MRILIYGSSAPSTPKNHLDVSYRLGELVAEKGHTLVFGGGNAGCMGAACAGSQSKGGKVVGVIHEKFVVDGQEARHIEMIVSRGPDLTELKQLLIDNGDCLITLPGGVGTFDEFWEAVSAKSLGFKDLLRKPICLVNVDGFYDGFITQIQRAFDDKLLYHNVDDFFRVFTTAEEALDWCVETYRTASSVLDTTSRKVSKPPREVSLPVHYKDFYSQSYSLLPFVAVGIVIGYVLSKVSRL